MKTDFFESKLQYLLVALLSFQQIQFCHLAVLLRRKILLTGNVEYTVPASFSSNSVLADSRDFKKVAKSAGQVSPPYG